MAGHRAHRLRLDIALREPVADGRAFDRAGPYERLVGSVGIAVDPEHAAYRGVVDIDKAPRNADGRVEYRTDVYILKPADLARGNRRLFFDWGNRGNKRCLQFFNDAKHSNDPKTSADMGNGFVMRRGYAVVWAQWQGDILPGDGRMTLDVPVATDQGKPIIGRVRAEFIADAPGMTSFPLSSFSSTRAYPAASLDNRDAALTVRQYPGETPVRIPNETWSFARVERGGGLDGSAAEAAVIPSDGHIHLPRGFEPGWIYELVYTARDPRVMGLGHAAIRDLASFFKYARVDDAGQPNPLAGVEKAYGWGRSQTGRCIRDFIYRGFNADAEGRRTFDGLMPHVSGGGLIRLNHRWSQPVLFAGQQHEGFSNYADRFPFAYAPTTDHLTGSTDSILKRPATDPLVIHTQTATEYWQRRGSLVHTDTRGNDLPIPDNVRVYLWASSQHFADPNLETAGRGICQNPINVVSTSALFRGALDALDRWATESKPPPASRVPRRADGSLATYAEWQRQFPSIPGVAVPTGVARLPAFDHGPEADAGHIAHDPPLPAKPGEEYATLVPAVDADGNDVAGVRMPLVSVPLATYTGWNLRARGFGQGAMYQFSGSTLPFSETAAERRATGDPRRSILERYGSLEGYVAATERAARALVADGLLLEEDVARILDAARRWGRPTSAVRLGLESCPGNGV